jgi:hypothetical protein
MNYKATMGFTTIQPISEEEIMKFAEVFRPASIEGISIDAYNGTPSSIEEFKKEDVTARRSNISLYGKSVNDLKNVLKMIDHNQIQKITIWVKEGESCTLNALHRTLVFGSMDMLPFPQIQDICKDLEIRNLTFHC